MINRWSQVLMAAFLFALAVRLASLGVYPLTDTTEARYGEVSRVMVNSGNWLTPQLEIGTPFWAKPPLSFWQSATSMSILGVSEFAARLPSFLNLLVVMYLLARLAREVAGQQVAIMSVLIVITTTVGFVNAGAVMTDPAMLLSTTLAMVSFWWAMEQRHKCWGYLFFVALALGLLAKGPIAWVVIGVPIVVWLTTERRWSTVFTVLPIVEGTALLGLTALPWFLIAEIETPGFLNYFFIGEHLQRYIDSGWEGDRYGTAHDEPRGMIWLFALLAFSPWSVVALLKLVSSTYTKGVRSVFADLSSLQRFLLLWCLWTPIFFTFAGNILPTYVLPGLPAFALLLALSLRDSRAHGLLLAIALLIPVIISLSSPLGLLQRLDARSQAGLIAGIERTHPDLPLIYVGKALHSARFYSRGSALFPEDNEELMSWLQSLDNAVLVVAKNRMPSVVESSGTLSVIGQQEKYMAYHYQHRAKTSVLAQP